MYLWYLEGAGYLVYYVTLAAIIAVILGIARFSATAMINQPQPPPPPEPKVAPLDNQLSQLNGTWAAGRPVLTFTKTPEGHENLFYCGSPSGSLPYTPSPQMDPRLAQLLAKLTPETSEIYQAQQARATVQAARNAANA